MKRNIYLDYNATTPLFPEAREAMVPFLDRQYGNPSSLHEVGGRAAREVRRARQEVAAFLGAEEETEIVFTSGGTESNNAVFRSVLHSEKTKCVIVTTAVEHSSILRLSRAIEEEGNRVIYLPVEPSGNLNAAKVTSALTPETALISVMAANNETGILFPLEEIAAAAKSKGVLFHTDAVQAAGKIPFSLKKSPVDFLSLSAHKFGGPKGVGVLYIKKGTPFRPLIFGGAQERGRRAGTENVPGIVGLGEACRKLQEALPGESEKLFYFRDYFEAELLKKVPGVFINGHSSRRLPNTSNVYFEGVDAEALLILLDEEGIYASSGSACLSGSREPSHVLKAMGLPDSRAKNSVRFSFGYENCPEDVEETVKVLMERVDRLRQIEFKEQHPHSMIQ
jgi:cysteine desulfurase